MNNSITQLLTDGVEEVFNPVVVYEGMYGFDTSVLSNVAKIVNGKNLFDEYMEKKIYSQIRNIFKNLIFTANPRLIFISDLEGSYGRSLKISAGLFLTEMALNITGEQIELPMEDSEIRPYLIDYFRNYRKNINKIISNNLDDDATKINEILYNNYLMNEDHRKRVLGANYRCLDYFRYLELIKDNISTFLVGIRYLIPFFDKPIDLKELGETLDMDKFFLSMTKQLIEGTKTSLEQYGKVHNSFVFIEKYIMAVKTLRENGKYDLSVKTCLLDGSQIIYSVDDAIKEYNEIRVAHPEFTVYSFESDGRDYRNLDLAKEFTNEVEEYVESKKLEASWEFVRNGSKETVAVDKETVERLSKKEETKKKLTRDQINVEITDRMNFLERTNYLYKITGKNNFEGYVGYIYSNGTVLFEKFYKTKDIVEPVLSNATYVMTFSNFVEMSKLTKTDIMEYIKQGGTDVRRIYHTNTWCDRIIQIISGKAYDEKTMDKIDRLINEGQISKKHK